MTIKFNVKMTEKAMYNFMIYHNYTHLSGIAAVLCGIVTLALGINAAMKGGYTECVGLFACTFVFVGMTPITLKSRAKAQIANSKMFQKELTYELSEEGVTVIQEDQSITNKWDEFSKVVSTGQSLILYVTRMRALIFPKESLGDQYAAAVQMISAHVEPKKVNIRHLS